MNNQDDNHSKEDEQFVQTAQELLRDSTEHLDGATLSRLNQARQQALAELSHNNSRSRSSWWIPAGAVVATAVLAAILWTGQMTLPTGGAIENQNFVAGEMPLDIAIDVELLLAEESLEMIEDLEFFAWLDAGLSAEELQAELELTG